MREELRTLVSDFTDLASRLRDVPVAIRADIYAALGVRLTYDPATTSMDAEVSPSHERLGKRVSEGELSTGMRAFAHPRGRGPYQWFADAEESRLAAVHVSREYLSPRPPAA
jgi:hypothetical protein